MTIRKAWNRLSLRFQWQNPPNGICYEIQQLVNAGKITDKQADKMLYKISEYRRIAHSDTFLYFYPTRSDPYRFNIVYDFRRAHICSSFANGKKPNPSKITIDID